MPSNPKATAPDAADLLASSQERLRALTDHAGDLRLDSPTSLATHMEIAQLEALIAIGLYLAPATT